MVQFCQENNLVIANTWFDLPKRRLYTWKSPQDSKDKPVRNQIDYITISKRFRNSIINAKTYPGCDINSDHNPVVATMRIKLKKVLQPKPPSRIAWESADHNRKELYRQQVDRQLRKECTTLQGATTKDNIEQTWTDFRDTLRQTGEQIIGKEDRKQRKPWMTMKILKLMDERRSAKNKCERQYKNIDKEIQRQIIMAKENWLHTKCDEAEQLQTQHKDRELHRKIKEITGLWRPKHLSAIANDNGVIELDHNKQQAIWENYLRELFGDAGRKQEYPKIDKGEALPILKEEVIKAIKDTKNNKAPGADRITAEHFKHISDGAMGVLTQFFNAVYATGTIPEDWVTSTFIALPKKNKAKKCEDHRTICLMSHAAKIFMRIIYNRIYKKCDDFLTRSQYGFRRGTGTREAILGLTLIAERYMEVQRKLYVCYVDYKKAFDRIQHEKLIEVLTRVGLDERDIVMIRNTYWNHRGCIRTEKGNTRCIDIQRGVRQGCILSPLLFNIYAEHIIRKSLQKCTEGAKVNGTVINNIRYADDTVVLAESEEHLQTLMNILAEESAEMGLEVNTAKTKTMIFSRNPQDNNSNAIITINGVQIETTQRYIYLGRDVNSQLDHSKEIRRRIEMARSGFLNMRKFLCHPKLPISTRLRTLKCYIWSLLLYGCETWTLKQEDTKRLNAFEMWMYRRMLRVSWTSRTTNSEVLDKMNTRAHLVGTIKVRKTAYLGHIMRHTEFEQIQLIIEGKIDGKRSMGRKKKSWLRNIRDWTHTDGNTLIHQAQDRESYAMLIANLNREGT